MIRKWQFILVLMAAGACSGRAGIVTFDFSTATGQNSTWNTGTTIDPHATTTGFADGSGVNATSGSARFNANYWNTGSTLAGAIGGNDYFGFVVTIDPGYAANLNGATVTFTLQSSWTGTSGNGPKNYALLSSIGGFTSGSELKSGTIAGTQSFNYTFASSGFDDETGNIEFRVYGWNAVNGSGTMSANNTFSLGGTINSVPEFPAGGAIAAAGLLALCGLRVWRQRRCCEKLKS
jgi:hypothetical protein